MGTQKNIVSLIQLFHKKGNLSYITKIQNAFCFKRGVLLGLKVSDFGWKRGIFCVQNPRKGGVFKLGYEQHAII